MNTKFTFLDNTLNHLKGFEEGFEGGLEGQPDLDDVLTSSWNDFKVFLGSDRNSKTIKIHVRGSRNRVFVEGTRPIIEESNFLFPERSAAEAVACKSAAVRNFLRAYAGVLGAET